MPELSEQAKELGRKIRLYTTKDLYTDHPKVDDNPSIWRKQDFISDVLLNAIEQKYFAPDRQQLQQLRDDFAKDTQIEINLDKLFDKYWLRFVTGIVYLPASIRGSMYSFNKIIDCKNELLFLRTIRRDKDKSITAAELKENADTYAKESGVTIDLKKASEAHLFSVEKDLVKNINTEYYAPMIDNWNDFLFLAFLYKNVCGEHSNLIISEETLKTLHLTHTTKYALTPPLNEMLSSGLATEVNDGYVISLFQSRYCSDETLDEAGAILWRKLNDVHKNLTQSQVLMIWCRRMVVTNGYDSDVQKHLTKGEKDQFNRAAVDLIMQQADLDSSPNEYSKALLDYYMDRDLMTVQIAERLKNAEFLNDTTDPFDTMKAISKAQRGTTDDYLYFAQSTRETISYLVGQIVKSHSCDHFQLDRIDDLSKGIHQKPYLLWTLCFWIWEWKPEIIPSLMKNTSITSVLFLIVKKLSITPHIFESSTSVKFQISSALFKHVLNILQSNPQTSEAQQAKIIFDCLLATAAPMFQIKGQAPKLQKEIQKDAENLMNDIRSELANRPDQYPVYDGHVHTKDKYYSKVLKDIFSLVAELTPENKYNNGTMDFQYDKISILLFLSELSRKLPYSKQHLKLSTYDLAVALLDSYHNIISAVSIPSLDYETWTPKDVQPIFLPATQNLEVLDWSQMYLLLEHESLSSNFLNPNGLSFNDSGDEYDSFNRFIIDKLRVHLRVLIISYNQLKSKEKELKQQGVQIDGSLIRLQNAILDIAIPNSFNEPSKHRFDIFNRIDERPSFGTYKDELIPQLGKVANNFPAEEREKLIKLLLRTDPLMRTVKLMENVTSELDQNLLLKTLNAQNLQEELGKLYMNDVQYLLSTLSKYSQFQDKAQEVLSYWEEHYTNEKLNLFTNEIKITTYRARLLQAFQSNDLVEIEKVPEPEGELYIHNTRIYTTNEKDFYRALYFFKNDDPEKAYTIFNDLMYRKDGDTTTIALNRFAAKIQWAKKETDSATKNVLFTESLSEWDMYQMQLPAGTSFDHLAENLAHNSLVAFDALERYDEFDNVYSALGFLERLRPGFFEIAVKNRLTRKMKPDAIALIKEASDFHRLKDGTIPEFVKEMNDLVVDDIDPETLKDFFGSLLWANPENLVKLIPDSVNPGKDVNSYILNNIVATAGDMLSKINSLAEIHFEDKYSDQMIFGLNQAMKFHHWQVSPARGGFSNSKLNNPGEIDFAVYASNSSELAVCEALNLYGENNVEVKKHSIKIFNYTPSKQGLFLIVYYRGKEEKFLNTWEKYKTSITRFVEFPESYSLVQDSFRDMSADYSNAAIRVGTSSHEQGITLYHIFININYKAVAVVV